MGVLGGSTTYLYWSARRVARVLEDNGLQINPGWHKKIVTPSIGGVTPQLELTAPQVPVLRTEVADQLERALGELVVEDLTTTYPVQYAKGVGSLVLGEFVEINGRSSNRAIIFTEVEQADYGPIAVCLFGSMDNFADYVQEASPLTRDGWTSSATPEIVRFLEQECIGRFPSAETGSYSREVLALIACNIATRTGEYSAADKGKPWRRGFTYGDIQARAEWFAQVFYDVDFRQCERRIPSDYRRAIIGAPLWVRTPRLSDLRLYQDFSLDELEASAIENEMPSSLRHSRLAVLLRRFADWLEAPRNGGG